MQTENKKGFQVKDLIVTALLSLCALVIYILCAFLSFSPYTDVAPGDVIFFDWDGGGSDHVGLVIGTDGTNVYTVEGNSGDACKIKSYPLNSQYIHGYGLMNW